MDKDQEKKGPPLLHIYPQKLPHDDVVIVTNKTALLCLKESIEHALEKGEGECVVTTADYERYGIKIILNDEQYDSDFWRRLQLPLFGVDESAEENVLSVEDILGFDLRDSEDVRIAQPIMAEYRQHNREMNERIKQAARRNSKKL